MAIGWLTVLQSVPWSEVIHNAPKVAEGAKKLWNAVARKSASGEDATSEIASSSEAQTIAALEARCTALEAAAADLHGQMLTSSELIKALADQNAQLIRHIETNRLRVLWLSATVAVLGVFAIAALVRTFSI